MLKSFGAMSNSRSEAESRRFDLTAGTAYGLIFGLCFGLYVWGRDGWLLAQTGADLAWSKLFIGLPLVLFICCLAGFLSALSASALFPVLIWSVAGVVLGILVGRIPYNAPNLAVWLLDQRLWGIPVFPYTHAGRMLMGIAAVVGAVLGAMVGLLQVFAQEWAWDRSGSKNRMTLAAWLVLWVSLPLAILFASIVDGEINKPIRGLQTSTGKIISLALSGGDDQELVQTVEGYRAVQPFVDRFTQDYVIHLSDYDTQTLLSGYTDIAFSNGFLLRCAVTRVASYSGVLHRVLTCYDLSQRLADRIEDLVYAGLKGERRWLADDMRAMVVKDTAFNWLRSQKSIYHLNIIGR